MKNHSNREKEYKKESKKSNNLALPRAAASYLCKVDKNNKTTNFKRKRKKR